MMTVLAWGNSLNDMFANVSIAKKGLAKMALTGCIAGPMFNMYLGLGASTLKNTLEGVANPFKFNLDI